VVAATNRPWDVDPAVWRRLPQRFFVGVPTREERCDLVETWQSAYQLPTIVPSVVEFLAESTEGYTPSDLYQIVQSACRKGPMAREDTALTMEDIQRALTEVPPTRFSIHYIHQLQGFMAPAHQQQQQQQQQYGSQQQQPHHVPHEAYMDGQPWETPMGNFYRFHVPVDDQVFDLLHELWCLQELEASDIEDYDDEDFLSEEGEEEEEEDDF
jgi:DNA primase